MELVGSSPGQWIADALAPYHSRGRRATLGSTVAGTVPECFEAHARILHRVDNYPGEPRRWADVAAANGKAIHPAVQFATIAGTGVGEGAMLEGRLLAPPREGELDGGQLCTLAGILSGLTGTPGEVFLAVWNGWGWLNGGSSVSVSLVEGSSPGASFPGGGQGIDSDNLALLQQAWGQAMEHARLSQAPAPAAAGQTLDVAGGFREYLVFRGTAHNLATPPWTAAYPGADSQSPNLAWPADHAWCVATEIDFDSTLVGGTAEAISAVVNSPELEALDVSPGTRLDWKADTINRAGSH
ncbi:hypothetical protein [Arthrobacter dokdonensis]|uniref:hypothetical protein n=1 Tax=Arthrobacter dokdonellae TaxID=2211210 RepID=UPI001493ECE5|nr:hypothetical protein [Arthrobacter dokdonellae]